MDVYYACAWVVSPGTESMTPASTTDHVLALNSKCRYDGLIHLIESAICYSKPQPAQSARRSFLRARRHRPKRVARLGRKTTKSQLEHLLSFNTITKLRHPIAMPPLLFRPLLLRSHRLPHLRLPRTTLRYSTTKPSAPSRISRLEARLPRFLAHLITPLRNAPISHITAFLLLHELTAIIPLFGLAATFHYTNYLPPYISEGVYVQQGTEIFGRWLRKRGWIDEEKRSGRWWGRGEGGVRIVVELATAYAVTKMLLPLRLVLSVWATPWFARWTVLPFTRFVGRVFWRGKKGEVMKVGVVGPAAGTGAVGGGVVPREGSSVVK